MTLFVQYGCGQTAPESWANFDVSPTLRLERMPIMGQVLRATGKTIYASNVRYGDIVGGLPVSDGSVTGLFCSHVLEHIDRASVELALANSFRMLAPGGVFRLIVPDFAWRAKRLAEEMDAGNPEACDRFFRSCYMGEPLPVRKLTARVRAALGNSAHRWMYDYAAMASLLEKAGFTAVRRCHLGDSEYPEFAAVEREDRFFDEGYPELAMEARRA